MLAQRALARKMGTILSFKFNMVVYGGLSIKKKRMSNSFEATSHTASGMQNLSLEGYINITLRLVLYITTESIGHNS